MEEPHPPIDSVEEHSAKTAEILRSMRTQADKALESHLRKIGDIETELSRRIQQIAEELARDRTVDEMEIAASHAQREELSNIRESLHKAETENAALHGQLTALASDQEAELAARAEQLQQLSEDRDQLSQERMALSEELEQLLTEQLKSSDELVELAEQLKNLQKDLDQTSHERDQLAEQLQQLREEHDELCLGRNSLVEDLEKLHTDHDKLVEEHIQLDDELEQLLADAEQNDRHREQLTGELEELGSQHESLQGERDQLGDELEQLLADAEQNDRHREQLTGELEQLHGQHAQGIDERDHLAERLAQMEADAQQKDQLREQLTAELEQLHCQHAQLSGERDQLSEEFQQLRAQHEQLTDQRDQLGGELQAAREALDGVREEKESVCTQLNEELAAAKERHLQAQEKSESFEAQLRDLQQEREQTCQALEDTRAASDKLTNEFTKNKQLVVELNETLEQQKTEHERLFDKQKEHLEQSDRKCELALADVHKLKRANAELHEELASRPETDDQDSPELVSLRAERDALAGRVEELESAPKPTLDDDSQQELSDLQRRFEMAVDDVRSLKQENASLREQLEASPAAPVEASDSGDMGWEAQRARLLAALIAEDEGEVTPKRREERTTVAGTITITDRVVSEKDREIADLKAQLQTRPAETKSEAQIEAAREESLQAAHEELLSTDEIIQTERGRLEQLQHEWKDKLRTAELEISVQRATLAREQAKLEEKLAFVESQATKIEKTDGKPKHRWLSALGLSDDEDDD